MYLWVLYPLTMLILELQEGPVQAHLRMLERVHQRARNTWCRVRWSLCLSEVVYEPMNGESCRSLFAVSGESGLTDRGCEDGVPRRPRQVLGSHEAPPSRQGRGRRNH